MGLVGFPMFVSWATTFNKPGGLSLPPTISVEKPNSSPATPSTSVCLILFGTSFDCEWHSPNLLRPTMILSMTGQFLWRCRLLPPQLCVPVGLFTPLPVIAQVCNHQPYSMHSDTQWSLIRSTPGLWLRVRVTCSDL